MNTHLLTTLFTAVLLTAQTTAQDVAFLNEGDTSEVLAQLATGESKARNARAIVLSVGAANTARRPASEETPIDTLRGIRRIVEYLRCHQPETKIVLRPLPADPRHATVNRELPTLADGTRIFWCADDATLKPTLDYVLGRSTVCPTGVTASASTAAKPYEPAISGWFDYRVSPKRAEIKRHRPRHFDVVFMGDSITHLWEERGVDVQREFLGQYDILNLGFSGDRTQNTLWGCQNGLLDGYTADAFTLMIGSNNRRDSDGDVARGITEIVREIRARQPQAQILLFNIFPRGKQPDDADRARVARVNALIAKLDDAQHVHYIRLWDEFQEPDGTISRWVMSDYLHPTAEGYAIWARKIAALLPRVLEPPVAH